MFANLVFENCTLDTFSPQQSVIDVGECPEDASVGKVQLHHVAFSDNRFILSPALYVYSISCVELEMRDVQFLNNSCSSICGARLTGVNELRDVLIESNRNVLNTAGVPSIINATPDSRTTIRNLTAVANNGSVLFVESAQLTLQDSVFSGNEGGITTEEFGYSASISVLQGTADIRRCSFLGNRAFSGAGVFADSATLHIEDCIFTSNTGDEGGAGVYLFQAPETSLQNSTFTNNSAPGTTGGAILAFESTLVEISQCLFEENDAESGGALYAEKSTVQLTGSSFLFNHADFGGGVYFLNGTSIRCDSLFVSNNTADTTGGGIMVETATSFIVSNLTSRRNYATDGGGLAAFDTLIMVIGSSRLRNNNAAQWGAAIYASGSTSIRISDAVFSKNKAERGSAVYLRNSGAVSVSQSRFERNNATDTGGALTVDSGVSEIEDCSFEDNSSERSAGALHCLSTILAQSRVAVAASSFLRNQAGSNGGGFFVSAGCLGSVSNTTWNENRASIGGAVYIRGADFVTFNRSGFTQNSADFGGAVYARDTDVGFLDIEVRDNAASKSGGAIGSADSIVSLFNVEVAENTADFGGGYYCGEGSFATINNTNFRQNEANTSGGGIYATQSSVTISNSAFQSNKAVENRGGGIGVFNGLVESSLHNVTAENNEAGLFGGGVYMEGGSTLDVSDCYIASNEALSSGGGVVSFGSTLRLRNTTVEKCKAGTTGGGVELEESTVEIQSCNLTDNFARTDGGGIYVSESELNANNVRLSRNVADGFGGGVLAEETPLSISNSLFEHNYATFGGWSLLTNLTAELTNVTSYNNSAFSDGGFAYARTNATLNMNNCLVNGSRGENGGAVFLLSSRLQLNNSEIKDGGASTAGGAISGTSGSFVVVQNSSLLRNTAMLGGAVLLQETYFWGWRMRVLDGEVQLDGAAIYANDSSSVLCSSCTFEGNSALGKGGAVYLDSFKAQLLAFQFDNCSFVNNSAALGGALHFVSEERSVEVDCSDPDAECTFMVLRGTNFTGNTASSAGGAFLTSDLNAIRHDCNFRLPSDPLAYITPRQFSQMDCLNSTASICPGWIDNRAEQYGDDLASYARSVKKFVLYEETNVTEEVQGSRYFLPDHLSGSQIPTLMLQGVDAMGQGPATGAGNETLEVVMWSPDRLFSGTVAVQLVDGIGNISGVAGYSNPGLFDVRLEFSDPAILPLTMVVEVRECRIGEASLANGTICQPCVGDSYNLFPQDLDRNCLPCPEEGKCDSAMIRPKKGYWHASPCSAEIQECLTERACDFNGRDERLSEMIADENSCDFGVDFLQNYTQAQCREGYAGPLCGSCQSTYGRSRSFRCEKCFTGFGNFLLVLLSVVVLLILSSFTIRSSIPHRQRPIPRALTSQKRPAAPQEMLDTGEPGVNLEMMEMWIKGQVPSKKLMRRPTAEPTLTEEEQAKVKELAKWKAVEIFKITVNYLQVLAIALAINVQWTDAMIGLFETAEFLGAVTSEAATRSVDCLISSDSIPRSAVRTVANITVPMVVSVFYFLFWALATRKVQETIDYFVKRYILSFLAVAYLSYIAVTKTAVNVLYCIEVHDSGVVGSDSTTDYWAVDTSLECYTESHAVLAWLVGWPVLIVFSFGFPVAILVTLVVERKKHNMKSVWLYESCGFLYRSYDHTFVYWESAIMLRKAVLAVVVAFSYPLGGNLQGVLSVSVLMLALYFQIVFSPFRQEFHDLNQLEGLSLLISALTFVAGLFFNDDRTSDGVRILLSTLLILANLGLFFYFVAMFVRASALYMAKLMEQEGIDYGRKEATIPVIKAFVMWRWSEMSEAALASKRNRPSDTVSQGSQV